MKKFVYRFLILAVSIFVAQFVLYIGIKYVLDSKSKFRLTRYFRNSKHDYYILGNSRAVNSVNEKYANDSLKLDLINLGFNGEPYKNIVDLLDDINSKVTHKTIFFEVSCITKAKTDYSYAYYIANSKFIKKDYSNTIYDKIALLRFNNEFFIRNIFYLNKSDNNWINNGTITPAIINEIDTIKSATIFHNNTVDFEKRMVEIAAKCAKSNNKVVFYLAPYFPKYLARISDYNYTLNFFKTNAGKYNFVDMNNVQLTQSMFMDKIHSNITAAPILTRYLMDTSKTLQ